MPVYKVDLVFEARGYGWTEVYYRDFPQADFPSANPAIRSLAEKRIALSKAPVEIEAYRITDPVTTGRQGEAVYFNPRIVNPGVSSVEDTGASAPSVAVNIRLVNTATNTNKRTQLRGVWDSIVTQWDALSSVDYAAWLAHFATYSSFLVQNAWGWLSQHWTAESQVVYSYAVGATAPTFTFPAAFFPLGQVNSFQRVRFSKFNGSKSPLNRELVVFVNSETVATASLPIAAGPMTSMGRCRRYAAAIFRAANTIGVERVGRRAPGRPLLRTPGRARARARS